MPRRNDWASRFGASRRAKDKAYCEEAERALGCKQLFRMTQGLPPDEIIDFEDEAQKRIARAFGRPVK